MLGEINVLLTAVAIGLAVDFTCFVALGVSAEIGRSQFGVRSVSQLVATMVAVINQLLASSIGDSRN